MRPSPPLKTSDAPCYPLKRTPQTESKRKQKGMSTSSIFCEGTHTETKNSQKVIRLELIPPSSSNPRLPKPKVRGKRFPDPPGVSISRATTRPPLVLKTSVRGRVNRKHLSDLTRSRETHKYPALGLGRSKTERARLALGDPRGSCLLSLN